MQTCNAYRYESVFLQTDDITACAAKRDGLSALIPRIADSSSITVYVEIHAILLDKDNLRHFIGVIVLVIFIFNNDIALPIYLESISDDLAVEAKV